MDIKTQQFVTGTGRKVLTHDGKLGMDGNDGPDALPSPTYTYKN
ncbi:hypothetical protein FYL99_RS20260 [Escherichia coli]